jgi:hypothetical protein
MAEIFLVSSVHRENGRCTAAELARILKFLDPEILFQEVPYFKHLNNPVFLAKPILEVSAISECLKERQFIQVPVDLEIAADPVFRKHEDVINRIVGMAQVGAELRRHLDQLIEIEARGGFELLNSRFGHWINRRTDTIIAKALRELGEEGLLGDYEDWKRYNSKRDEVMLENIYSFCHDNRFERGVFLFGAGHRRSLISKIQKARKIETVPISWRLLTGSGPTTFAV